MVENKPVHKKNIKNIIYVDGTDMVLGRLSSYIAKESVKGNHVVLLNCEKVVKTGQPNRVVEAYIERITSIKGRHKGPFWPRRPDTIMRRAIRRMLPYKNEKGKNALLRIEIYIGFPKEYEAVKMEQFEKARMPKTKRFITLGQLSERISAARWK